MGAAVILAPQDKKDPDKQHGPIGLTSVQQCRLIPALRRSNMKTKPSWKRLVIVFALGFALLGIPGYFANEVNAVGINGGNSVRPASTRQDAPTFSDDISVAST